MLVSMDKSCVWLNREIDITHTHSLVILISSHLSTATEIRCQEMSKGGLAYEVILAEPVGVPAPRRADSPEKIPSVEEIQEKLKAAEERRRVSRE